MTARAKKPAEPVLVTDWYGHDVKPVHVGAYEVRNTGPAHYRKVLVGGRMRWWDGAQWLTEQGGQPSTMGSHHTHQWRGRRMWVLVRRADPPMSSMDWALVDDYLISARPRSAKFGDLASARPFKTERQAKRFAARYSHLGLTAVLP